MSVHTRISEDELEQLLAKYAIAPLSNFTGINDGITNTNYRVNTSTASYVLTLFEQDAAESLDFFLQLMSFLAAQGLACPQTIADKQQRLLQTLHNKPAALIEFLPGQCIEQPSPQQCKALGKSLALLHQYGAQFSLTSPNNSRGNAWRDQAAKRLLPVLDDTETTLLQAELVLQQQQDWQQLPQGLIHADLFRDNVLFVDNEISGLIDFYYACHDYLLLDIAIVINDWCSLTDGSCDDTRLQAILQGYQSIRPLTAAEQQVLPIMRHRAALRFWLSRLLDWHFPPVGEAILRKDPEEYRQILVQIDL